MTVENLTCLPNLKVKPRLHTCINFSASATQLLTSKEEQALDLSYNLINFVPPTELPPSILYLTTEGNPLLQMVFPLVFLSFSRAFHLRKNRRLS